MPSNVFVDLHTSADQLQLTLCDDLGDRRYFMGHRSRFIYTCSRVFALCPPGSRVLDNGSHLLHASSLLSASGYKVEGLDVSLFSRSSLAIKRANQYSILNHSCDDFSKGDFLGGCEGKFD